MNSRYGTAQAAADRVRKAGEKRGDAILAWLWVAAAAALIIYDLVGWARALS